MTSDPCRLWREQIGVYVLGRLEGTELASLEAHLDGCPACRQEVAELRGVADVLPAADPQRIAVEAAPPRDLADRVIASVQRDRSETRRRRRRRIALRVGPALAGLAAGAVAFVAVSGSGSGPAPGEAIHFRSLPPGMHISARLADQTWGTQVRVQVEGLPRGTLCQVWVRRDDGTRVPAGSFRYLEDRDRAVVLGAAVHRVDASAVGLRAGARTFVAYLS